MDMANRDSILQVVSILSRKGRCERASIDEVYLDLTDAAETMLAETPPESLEEIDEEVLRSHILGLSMVGKYAFSIFSLLGIYLHFFPRKTKL